MGDCRAASPSRISLCLLVTDCDNYRQPSTPPDLSPDSGQESDYENSPSSTKLDRLGNVSSLWDLQSTSLFSASEVANLAGVDVKREVFDALELNAYCVTAAVDYLINVRSPSLPPSLLPLYGAFDWVTLLISLAGLICLTFSFAIWIILIILVIY